MSSDRALFLDMITVLQARKTLDKSWKTKSDEEVQVLINQLCTLCEILLENGSNLNNIGLVPDRPEVENGTK